MNQTNRPDTPSNGQKIEKLYAWVGEEADGSEGIVAGLIIPGMPGWSPLVGADRARMESLRAFAEEMAYTTGRTVRLKVFGSGVMIDEIKPKGDYAKDLPW